MEMRPVESSMLESIGFDGNALYVKYRNGASYRHAGVTRKRFDELLASKSKGEFFNKQLRKQHPGKKI